MSDIEWIPLLQLLHSPMGEGVDITGDLLLFKLDWL